MPHDPRIDLRRTLRPLHGRFLDDGWWLTARTSDGPATLRISRRGSDVLGDAWGEGAETILNRLPAIVGHHDPADFHTEHPLISALGRRPAGSRLGPTDALMTGTEAARAWSGLSRAFSEPAPGPDRGMRLPPDPERMATAPYWEFHELHLEKRRADVIRRVSREASRIQRLADVAAAEAAEWLMRMNGIGPWTVAGTLEVSHGDPDQVAVGDYHLKNIIVYHLTGRARGTDEEMMELLEEFRPNRGRVVRLLLTLGPAPKFGPRSTPRNITRL
mgnify:CR=1 FL=1